MIQLVRLCTGLDDEALRELNRSAAVLFLPLREAAANALLEAMSSGLPVVTTDRPATRESAGDCSVYFEPGSVPQAVSGLAEFLRSDRLRVRLGQACRERAARHLWETVARRHTQLYEGVLDL